MGHRPSVPQVIGDKVLEEEISFPVSLQEQLRQTRRPWDLHRETGICQNLLESDGIIWILGST